MMVRLRKIGDIENVAILEVILREEVNHVAIGTRWFQYLCAQRRLDATQPFRTLLAEHGVRLRPPLTVEARRAAGFVDAEIQTLRPSPFVRPAVIAPQRFPPETDTLYHAQPPEPHGPQPGPPHKLHTR